MSSPVSFFIKHKNKLLRALIWTWLLTGLMYVVMILWGMIGSTMPVPVSIIVAAFIYVISLGGDLLLTAVMDTSDILLKNPLMITATFFANTIISVIVVWIDSVLRHK